MNIDNYKSEIKAVCAEYYSEYMEELKETKGHASTDDFVYFHSFINSIENQVKVIEISDNRLEYLKRLNDNEIIEYIREYGAIDLVRIQAHYAMLKDIITEMDNITNAIE